MGFSLSTMASLLRRTTGRHVFMTIRPMGSMVRNTSRHPAKLSQLAHCSRTPKNATPMNVPTRDPVMGKA